MAPLTRLLPLCLLAANLVAQDTTGPIARAAQALRPRLVETRRDFHQHPELSNREERTARVVAERLRALGLEVRTGVARHGVVALLRGALPGPVVALRSDMDALPIQERNEVPYRSENPGVMHACGHDVHMTVLLGTAEVLAGMRDHLRGTVKFIFQPAEEGAPPPEEGGAALMVAEGVLDNPRPKVILAFHVAPQLEVGTLGTLPGGAMASSDYFSIRITGRAAHGALPHQGLDAILVASECVTALQSIRSRRTDALHPMVLSVGTIHGGARSNIVAEEVVMEGTLRALDAATRTQAMGLMRQILAGVTSAHGATLQLSFADRALPAVINDPALVAASLPAFRKALGDTNVLIVEPWLASEDFSFYQKVIPGCMAFLGVGNPAKGLTSPLHTPTFNADEEALVFGVKAMATWVVETLAKGN
jgi:amidohydrolase